MRLLALARDLRRRRGRERQELFVAEGVRAVEELVRSPLRLRGALVAPPLGDTARGAALRESLAARGIPVQEVSERELADAADTESPQGVLAMAEIPERSLPAIDTRAPCRLLLLDAVQDPGNVGTMLRTAAAFGVAATIALPGTVDLWNPKVVRSAMGALFHRAALPCTWDALDGFLTERGVELWGASADGEPLPGLAGPDRLALAVGNEGRGLTDETRRRARRHISIPIAPDVESLNVAVATGILLYSLRP